MNDPFAEYKAKMRELEQAVKDTAVLTAESARLACKAANESQAASMYVTKALDAAAEYAEESREELWMSSPKQ